MSLFEFKKFEHPKTETVTLSSVPEKDEGNVQRAVQNLVTHIPGEATGFYMLAIAYLVKEPNVPILFYERMILFVLAMVLLLLVRIISKASVTVIITSSIAFILWMFIIPNGAFVDVNVISTQWKLIIAAFYSAAVTVLANAGKLK
jgi:hypothetical protein